MKTAAACRRCFSPASQFWSLQELRRHPRSTAGCRLLLNRQGPLGLSTVARGFLEGEFPPVERGWEDDRRPAPAAAACYRRLWLPDRHLLRLSRLRFWRFANRCRLEFALR